jgi:response regulator RpfG family c-di-GMP phosphodiesterase
MINKPTILYVDDEPINLQIFELNFKHRFNLLLAESGATGLEILKAHPEIKIVLSDMRMPGMNGIEFITTAKRLYPLLTFFILTGYEITEEIRKALKEGLVYKYFKKPCNLPEIEASIYTVLGQ